MKTKLLYRQPSTMLTAMLSLLSLCSVSRNFTAPQHLVCRAVQSLHTNHIQMSIIEVFICRRLHMNTSMILICIWLVCRLCTTLHTKCCGAVLRPSIWHQNGTININTVIQPVRFISGSISTSLDSQYMTGCIIHNTRNITC